MEALLHPFLEAVAAEVDGPGKAVIVTDAEGIILWWSRGAEELYGWRSAEVLGRDILAVTPTELSAAEGARIMRSLQTGIPWRGSFVVRVRSGERLYADVLDIPVRGELGELVGIVGVSRRSSYLSA